MCLTRHIELLPLHRNVECLENFFDTGGNFVANTISRNQCNSVYTADFLKEEAISDERGYVLGERTLIPRARGVETVEAFAINWELEGVKTRGLTMLGETSLGVARACLDSERSADMMSDVMVKVRNTSSIPVENYCAGFVQGRAQGGLIDYANATTTEEIPLSTCVVGGADVKIEPNRAFYPREKLSTPTYTGQMQTRVQTPALLLGLFF